MPDNTEKTIQKFFSEFRDKNHAKGAVIIQADSKPEGVFYLNSGLVREFDISDSGQKVTLNIFKPGAFFPMSWAINDTNNKYFFETLKDCSVKIAPASRVVEFIKQNSDVMYDLLARVYRGTDGIQGRQSRLMASSAINRLGYELLIYAKRFNMPNKKGEYHIKMTESDLASFTGLARETVSRQLQKMASSELIKLEGGQIVIKNIYEFEKSIG